MIEKIQRWLDLRIAEILAIVQRDGLLPKDSLIRNAGALAMAKALKAYIEEELKGDKSRSR